MALTDLEIIEIEEICKTTPCVKKLYDEFNIFNSDPAKRFYRSITECTNAISKELDSVHNGNHSNFKILMGDKKVYNRIYQLLANSRKILEGLEMGGNYVRPGSITKEDAVKQTGMSLTDQLAENNKSK